MKSVEVHASQTRRICILCCEIMPRTPHRAQGVPQEKGLGFRVFREKLQGLGFRVSRKNFRVQGLEFLGKTLGFQGLEFLRKNFRVQGLPFGKSLGFQGLDFGFRVRVQGLGFLGFRFQGLGFLGFRGQDLGFLGFRVFRAHQGLGVPPLLSFETT